MELFDHVSLQIEKTDKFKDIGISIRFMAPLSKETASLRSLLAIMICDRCDAYPSKKAMSDIQDCLYGLSLHAQTIGYGKAQVLEIRIKVIDPRYVKETDLLSSVFAYLHEVLFHPLFSEDAFAEAKEVLKAKLQRLRDDPAQYAIAQGLKLAGEGTPLAVSSLGDLEQLAQITLADVKAMHQKLLYEDRIDMIICGQVEEKEIIALIKEQLPFPARKNDPQSHYLFTKDSEPLLLKEKRKVKQCNILMIWQTNMDICDPDYYALRVANAMFGQYPTSLLFREVREKHSLCYTVFANLISFDGVLTVTTGVESEHTEEAIALIKQQFERIVNGDYPPELLDVSKTMIINSLKASKDAMPSVIAQLYQNQVLKQELSIDERMERIRKVSDEDVQRVFQNCAHRLSFVVCQEDDEHEASHE